MAKHDIDLCHPPQKTSFVMLNKHIYESEAEAKKVLIERHLAPGEMAAVRYGEDDGFGSYKNVGMILGIGGAAFGGQDTYFFTGDKVVDTDLSNYYNKEQINELFYNKEQINELLKEINDKFDKYYTKGEIDDLIKNIDIDYDAFYTKEKIDDEIENINNNINNVSTSISTFETTLNEINENVTNIENTYVTQKYANETYVTNEYVQNTYVTQEFVTDYVEKEVSSTVVEIIQTDPAINETISEKVNEVVSQEVVTKENFSTVIQEYYSSEEGGDYDGGNEEDWPSPDEIESTDTPATPGEDGGEEESW